MSIDYLALRQQRIAKNLTLHDVAAKVGIHSSYLSKIERGEATPSTLVQLRLESMLGVVPQATEHARQEDVQPDRIDRRNKLNELTGKEWIQETKTVWRQRGLGANHEHTKYEKLHPAPFSFQDVARLIRFFTKRNMLVLDPFCGVGSTLKACALEGRRGLGIELSPRWAELSRLRLQEEVPDDSQQHIWCMDVQEAIDRIEDESIDFIVTSPPYWSILNKRPDHKTKEVRLAQGLAQSYSDDERDLGNISDYTEFLDTLVSIFEDLAAKLRPGAYCTIIVSDFKHGPRFYPFHSDLYSRIDEKKLSFQGIIILEQTHKSLYPYGYPYAYVPNIHHQYILIFRRPRAKKLRQKKHIVRLIERAKVPDDLSEAIKGLRALPYKSGALASRHWGHKRHTICSFPSKMKPALAATLVSLFTRPDSTVFDPLSGSGTLPFEAALQGRYAIGGDLAPLSYVITSAKVVPPAEEQVQEVLQSLESHIEATADAISLDAMEPEIREFYHERTAREIITARAFLAKRSNGFREGSALLFITACLAHILHGNRPYALSRRSHNIIPIPPKGPVVYKSVMASLRDKCHRMLSFPLPASFRHGRALLCPADAVPLDNASVDVVLTSPPFLGTTDFLRHNRLRNWLLGWDYETQAAQREHFLEHQTPVEGYRPILSELHRVLRPHGLMVFHVGIVKTVSMADLLSPLFAEAGFREVSRIWEDTSHLESHGRTDRGGTHTHGFVVCTRG
jgi:DNA modification methylase/DNA-binding XRE family transcriptional regulator